jgi:hypothetical protein
LLSKEEIISHSADNSFELVIKQRLQFISMSKQHISHFTHTDQITGETNKITVVSNTGDHYKANTIVNDFTDFIEIIKYKDEFDYVLDRTEKAYNEQGEKLLKSAHPRNFFTQNGIILPKAFIDWEKVEHSKNVSLHRSKDNFYAYVLCNKWKYFVTLTFNPKRIDRHNDKHIKQAYKVFRQQLQRINKNVKIIVVPEPHNDGALHFHGFIGDIDLSNYLGIMIDKNGKKCKSKSGEQLYELSLFKYGYNTVAVLPEDCNRTKIANYCISYVTKTERIGYNKKAYYRTTNLDYKNKVISYFTDRELEKLTNDLFVTKYKENDKMIVYRKLKTEL